MIQEAREIARGEAEPKCTEERKVVKHGDSLYVNITDYAVKTHDIKKGDQVDVHHTDHGFSVDPNPENTEGPK